jgi:MFS-type transporter involved in bile tolerance (Atg22 family)
VRLSLVITALYFVLFAASLLLWLRERAQHQPLPPGESYLTVATKRLRRTFSTVMHPRELVKFVAAFLWFRAHERGTALAE